MLMQLDKVRFSVDRFEQMTEAGIFSEDDRIELIEGELIKMSPIGTRHAACVDRLNYLLVKSLSDLVIVRVQSPIILGQYSEPEPDLTLLKPRKDFYVNRHPGPTDVKLIVEVSDKSLGYDREVKLPLYAKANIPEVWIVNLEHFSVEMYTNETQSGYESMNSYAKGQLLKSKMFPQLHAAVDDIL